MIDTKKFYSAMKAAGYTTKDLASKIGWSEKELVDKVGNEMSITIQEIKKLVDILKITDVQQMFQIFLNNVIFGKRVP